MKKCTKCSKEKELQEFYDNNAWCRKCCRDWQRAHKYGITVDQMYELLEATNCEICGIELNKKCIDHNHNTGQVRGILCDPCNRKLGFLEQDNTNFYNYLDKYASK